MSHPSKHRKHNQISRSGLPVLNAVVRTRLADDGKLLPLLAMPRSPMAVSRYGMEVVIGERDGVVIVDSRTHRRFLWGLPCPAAALQGNPLFVASAPPQGMAMGGLEVRKPLAPGQPAILDTVFVLGHQRGQGIASRLLEAARREFPELVLTGELTADGIQFFGVGLNRRRTMHEA